ncbi:MAG: hypothetical protein ACOCUI_00565 [bacterium]
MKLNLKERKINVVFNNSVKLEEKFMENVFLNSLKKDDLRPFWINLDYYSKENDLAQKIDRNTDNDLEDSIIFQDYYRKNEAPENNDKEFILNLSGEFDAISNIKLNSSYDLLIISGIDFYNKSGFNKNKFYGLSNLLQHFIRKYRLTVIVNIFVPKKQIKYPQIYKSITTIFDNFSFLFNEKGPYGEERLYDFNYINETKNRFVLFNLELENEGKIPTIYNIYTCEKDKYNSLKTTKIPSVNDLFIQNKLMDLENSNCPAFLSENKYQKRLENKLDFKEKNNFLLKGENKKLKERFIRDLIFYGLKKWEFDIKDIGYLDFNKDVSNYYVANRETDKIRNKHFHPLEMSEIEEETYSKNQAIINKIDKELEKKILIVDNVSVKSILDKEYFFVYKLIKYRQKSGKTTFLLSENSLENLEEQIEDKDYKKILNYWGQFFAELTVD